MKKILAIMMMVVLMISAVPTSAANLVKVAVDYSMVEFDQPPVIIEGRTLVPIRAVAEKLGATVKWNGETNTVSVIKDAKGVALAVNNTNMSITNLNNMKVSVKKLDVAPQNINGRTLMPIRALVEEFGCRVEWDNDTSTVLIFTGDPTPAKKTVIIGD